MKKHLITLVTLLVAGSGVIASDTDFIASPKEPHAIVIGSVERPGHQIFPVVITEINGRRIIDREEAVWLKPGTYEITATRARVDLTLAGATRSAGNYARAQNTIELTVEEGKHYYIGLHASGSDRAQWKVVNWKTE